MTTIRITPKGYAGSRQCGQRLQERRPLPINTPGEQQRADNETLLIKAAVLIAAAWAMVAAVPALAADVAVSIVIKNHVFDPTELKVPAGKSVELTVHNQDPTPEEFESADLRVEKIVPGNSSAKVRFGPLDAGTYLFIGEFNQKTARGAVTAE